MPRKIPAATKAAVVADYLGGTSAEDVAEEYGISGSSVLVWVRAAGETVRGHGRPSGDNAYKGKWVVVRGVSHPLKAARGRVA